MHHIQIVREEVQKAMAIGTTYYRKSTGKQLTETKAILAIITNKNLVVIGYHNIKFT